MFGEEGSGQILLVQNEVVTNNRLVLQEVLGTHFLQWNVYIENHAID